VIARALLTCGLVALVLAGSGPAGADTGTCPTFNLPNELVLDSGTPQSARLGTAFGDPLAVTAANTNGCPVTTALAGLPVTFTAPSSGPSGTFAASGSNGALVGTNAQGSATAMFTANSLVGGYLVTASADFGSVTFSLVNTAGGVSTAIVEVGGGRQAVVVGNRFGKPLSVVVTDGTGKPVDGAAVTFSLGGGAGGGGAGGTAAAGATFVGGSTQATTTTDATGTATSPAVVANDTTGRFVATASTPGVVAPAVFALKNLAAKAPSLRLDGVARQSAKPGARFPHPLEVVVRTAAGAALEGATVTFSLGDGGGGGTGSPAAGASFVGGASQATAVTNARGIAVSPLFTADSTAGRFSATASVADVMRPVTFSLRNLPVPASSISAWGDPAANAPVESSFRDRLHARVVDGRGSPVAGAAVTFALGSGAGGGAAGAAGATFTGGSAQATAVTGANGVATSPLITANGVAGSYAATATSTAAPGTADYPLRNLAGKPKTVTAGAATGETAKVGARFPVRPAVVVDDAKGNAVPGAVVTFSVPSSGAGGRFAGHRRTVKVKTDAAGVAVAPSFVANRVAGGYVIRATVPGARPAAFALVNLPKS
jgi:hypothetical protein